jgi:SMC interacting uncharacterized protein involved in chromosome segregation
MLDARLFVALLALSPTRQAQMPDPNAADVLVIDGKKDPGQLPEWLVWEHAFMQIAMLKGKDTSITLALKEGLSTKEFDLLEQEALEQDRRLEKAVKEAEPLQEQFKRRDPNDGKLMASLNDQMQELNVRYRRTTLDARDRVLQALAPESQQVLWEWLGEIRASITARVSKRDLERWRAPE